MSAAAGERGLGPTVRVGIGICAAAGVAAAVASRDDLASGPGESGATTFAAAPPSLLPVALAAAVLLAGAAAVDRRWASLGGIALGTAAGFFYALVLGTARQDAAFLDDADPSLEGGGVILLAAFLVSLLGVLTALSGLRHAPPPTPEEIELASGRASGKATASLILGIVGFVFLLGVPAALAIAFSQLANVEIRASDGRVLGRGFALAGLVCGIVFLSLWSGGMLLFTLAATPA